MNPAPAPEAHNPFVGLRPFESEDSLYFFGRDTQSREVLARLHQGRFVAVVGSSGSGKSSLVRASVIPRLEAGFLVQDRDAWTIATMKPGEAPLHNFARALLTATGDASGKEEVERLVDRVRRQGVEALRSLLCPHLQNSDANLLLLVDQFEEIFRFSKAGSSGCNAEDVADLVRFMLALSEEPALPTFVCLTMRSDYLGDCDTFAGLPETMNRSQYLVPRLTRKERRDAITGPIHLTGVEITARLVDRLLNENIGIRDDLPVLQHALLRTWDAWARDRSGPIDMEHYERIGTIQDALSLDADEALRELSPDHQLHDERQTPRQALAKRLFQALTAVDAGNRHVRRPVHLREFAESTGATPEEVLAVVERFRTAGRSFLVLSPDDPAADPLIDISHESLIRQWKRLNDWVTDEAASAKVYQRLADTAQLYRQGKAGLYPDADLQVALDWQTTVQPTAAWAGRYHPAFAEALAFLDASRAERQREREVAAANERARVSRLRRLLVVFGAGMAIAGLAAFVMLTQWKTLQNQQATLDATNTNLASKNDALNQALEKLEEHKKQLEEQKIQLEDQKTRLEEQTASLQTARDTLAGSVAVLANARQTFKDTIDIAIRALNNEPGAKRDFDAFIRSNAKVFYGVDIWVFGETESIGTAIASAVKQEGYTVSRDPIIWKHQANTWIAKVPTVFYYNKYSQEAAADIGRILKGVTGHDFSIARGGGFGVTNEEKRWKIIVHDLAPGATRPAGSPAP